MARVTIEDCSKVISNRFKLVMYAARRSREIYAGAPLTVIRDNDKNPIVALREIAEGNLPLSALEEAIIISMQRHFIREDESEFEVEDEEELLNWKELDTASTLDPEAMLILDS